MSDPSKAVLITGCSTGIGRATAERLARKGHTVYATARRRDSIADLEAAGCRLVELDVCSEASMVAAVNQIQAEVGVIGVLVNNAGYSQSGAVESVSMDSIRRQFETNVFGLVRMCQLVLPGMRDQQWGRIVNVSSIGGKLVFPGGGIYHATKHAVEAISDALRFEVQDFGIGITILEPGLIRTQFGETAAVSITEGVSDDGVYGKFNADVGKVTLGAYAGPIGKIFGAGPDSCAVAIERAITARRAPIRKPVTPSAHMLLTQRKLMPDRIWDMFVGTQYRRPKP